MEQCQKEARELYPAPIFDEHRFVQTTDTALAVSVNDAKREAYAQAISDKMDEIEGYEKGLSRLEDLKQELF